MTNRSVLWNNLLLLFIIIATSEATHDYWTLVYTRHSTKAMFHFQRFKAQEPCEKSPVIVLIHWVQHHQWGKAPEANEFSVASSRTLSAIVFPKQVDWQVTEIINHCTSPAGRLTIIPTCSSFNFCSHAFPLLFVSNL